VKRIRWGEVAATLIVMATGAAVSYQQKDPFPLAASLMISVIFVAGYEYQIAHPSTEDAPAAAPATSTPVAAARVNGTPSFPWSA
jgi:hypothetical protein